LKYYPGYKQDHITLVEITYKDKKYGNRWKYICVCGKQGLTWTFHLSKNKPKSCGCKNHDKKRLKSFRVQKGPGYASLSQAYGFYKHSAKKKQRTFEITLDLFMEVVKRNCYYCGVEPNNHFKTEYDSEATVMHGIDRVDSSKGYELSNIVTCCKICNIAKRDLTVDKFKDWVIRISDNLKRNGWSI